MSRYLFRVWHRAPRDWRYEVKGVIRGDIVASGTRTNRGAARDAALAVIEDARRRDAAPWVRP